MKRLKWTGLLVAGLVTLVSALAVVLKRSRPVTAEKKGVSLDYMADIYGLMDRAIGLPFRHLTISLAAIEPGDRVLDIGCATGTLAIMEKEKAGPEGRVAAVDIGLRLIAKAKRRAAERRLDVDFQVGSIDAMPFPDDFFDVATSSGMVHHLPDEVKLAGFKEVHRVLKPGGRYLIVGFSPATGIAGRTKLAIVRWLAGAFEEVRYSLALLEGRLPRTLEEAGFEEVEELGSYRLAGVFPMTFVLARKSQVE